MRTALAAGVAQLVEQLTCNQQVGGSNPFASSNFWDEAAVESAGRGRHLGIQEKSEGITRDSGQSREARQKNRGGGGAVNRNRL